MFRMSLINGMEEQLDEVLLSSVARDRMNELLANWKSWPSLFDDLWTIHMEHVWKIWMNMAHLYTYQTYRDFF